MDIVGILTGIGVNQTFVLQLVIFLVVFYFMTYVVFKPYQQAYMKRRELTEGSEEAASDLVEKTKTLEQEYSQLARRVNDQVKSKFDEQKEQANKQASDILKAARSKAETEMQASRDKLEASVKQARAQLKQEAPAVSKLVVAQLVGKEL